MQQYRAISKNYIAKRNIYALRLLLDATLLLSRFDSAKFQPLIYLITKNWKI